MATTAVKVVPRCMRAVPAGPLSVAEVERAYVVLRRVLAGTAMTLSDARAVAGAADVLDDVLSMQEG